MSVIPSESAADRPIPGSPARLAEPTTQAAHDPVAQLNAFLCGEIAAAETYRLTAEKFANSRDAALYVGLLRQFQEEHDLAADVFRDLIREQGGDAVECSGAWGAWAKAVHCTGDPFGGTYGSDDSVLACLRHGEVHTMEELQGVARALPDAAGRVVREQLIPALKRHARMLGELLGDSAGR